MGNRESRTATGLGVGRKHPTAASSHLASVAATTLLLAVAGASQGHAAGETIGYSAPFLMSQFEVILQDQTVAAAKAAGLNVLSPTNADQDSGKQITDIRNLIGAGATGAERIGPERITAALPGGSPAMRSGASSFPER